LKLLFVIPARGGSKGIPGKNTKLLAGKPLIHYSIEYARLFAQDADICLTTDDLLIAESAALIGYNAPFIRPASLAADNSSTYSVLRHTYQYYYDRGILYDAIILLQPTSPLRTETHLREAMNLFDKSIDMVVSVTESSFNPYYNLFEERQDGLIQISKGDGSFTRRQDVPPVFAYNGSIYIINTSSLIERDSFSSFKSVKKYLMDEKYATDLDTLDDWNYMEYIFKNKLNE
jgi:CMP-N,N'-diacetyllegionaminic acid synthase